MAVEAVRLGTATRQQRTLAEQFGGQAVQRDIKRQDVASAAAGGFGAIGRDFTENLKVQRDKLIGLDRDIREKASSVSELTTRVAESTKASFDKIEKLLIELEEARIRIEDESIGRIRDQIEVLRGNQETLIRAQAQL